MSERLDFSSYAWQVRKLSRGLMRSVHSVADVSGRMHLLTVASEKDLLRFGTPPASSRVVCGPGCGDCCILNVTVLLPEAITIASFLQRRMSDGTLRKLRGRLQELTVRTRWLDDEERVFVREPCAFLDQKGSCLIHAVRPLLCRAVTSTDAGACRDSLAMAPLDATQSVEMDLFQKQLFDTVYVELAQALEDLGFDHRPRRLSAAILALLTEPGTSDTFFLREKVPIQ